MNFTNPLPYYKPEGPTSYSTASKAFEKSASLLGDPTYRAVNMGQGLEDLSVSLQQDMAQIKADQVVIKNQLAQLQNPDQFLRAPQAPLTQPAPTNLK